MYGALLLLQLRDFAMILRVTNSHQILKAFSFVRL